MGKKAIVVLLVALALISVHPANAQQPARVVKIGWLAVRPARDEASNWKEVTQRELRALGYVEGRNIASEYRSAENKLDTLPALADELVRLKVDVITMSTMSAALAAKNITKTVPIVFLTTGDPVAAGLVDSLARPGGNITGFTEIGVELVGKRLELLKETIPRLSRVAVLWNPGDAATAQTWEKSQLAARELDLQLHSMEIGSANDIESAFKDTTKARTTALAVPQSALFNSHLKRIVDLAAKNRLPAIYSRREYVESGGLMSYGPDRVEPYKRVASMIDKILKGTKPADIPVEQPTKFELLINLKTAKALGLTIPPVVMMRAEKVIK